MEDLNNVPSSGTYGAAINEVNSNFSLVVNAINSLEYATTKSKGIYNNGFTPNTTTLPNSASGDWCMVLGTGNTFPATIWTFNGTTWAQGGTWNPDGINLNDYATTSALNTAVANSLAQATARMGYGEATANNNAYSVTIANYTLPTNGGVVRVKMPTAATGAATLNISSTGAKTIWYNGKAVSSTNTWEAEEIISVFHDGTRFMASNSQGGGGKAEKIKYDNSASGLAAENVQEAVDEIQGNSTLVEVLDKEGIADGNYRITSAMKWSSTSSEKHYYIPCTPGDAFRLTGNANVNYIFATQHTVSSGATVYPCSGYTASPTLHADETVVVTAPEDATVLIINKVVSGNDVSPSLIEKIAYVKPKELQKEVNDIEESIKVYVDVPLYGTEFGNYRLNTSKQWTSGEHYWIPCSSGDTFKITAGTKNCNYVFLKSHNNTGAIDADVSSIYSDTNCPVLYAGGTVETTCPEDSTGLVVNRIVSGNNTDIKKIEKIENIDFLQTETSNLYEYTLNGIKGYDSVKDFTEINFWVGSTSNPDSWLAPENRTSVIIDVPQGSNKMCIVTGDKGNNYFLLKSNTVPTSAGRADLATGVTQRITISANNVQITELPSDCVAVGICSSINNENYFPSFVGFGGNNSIAVGAELKLLQKETREQQYVDTESLVDAVITSKLDYIHAFSVYNTVLSGGNIFLCYSASTQYLDESGRTNDDWRQVISKRNVCDLSNEISESIVAQHGELYNGAKVGVVYNMNMIASPDESVIYATLSVQLPSEHVPTLCTREINPDTMAVGELTPNTLSYSGHTNEVFTKQAFFDMLYNLGLISTPQTYPSGSNSMDNPQCCYYSGQYYKCMGINMGGATAQALVLLTSSDMVNWTYYSYVGPYAGGETSMVIKNDVAYISYRNESGSQIGYVLYNILTQTVVSDGVFPQGIKSKPCNFIFNNVVYMAINETPLFYGYNNGNDAYVKTRQEVVIYSIANDTPVPVHRFCNHNGCQYMDIFVWNKGYDNVTNLNNSDVWMSWTEDRRKLSPRRQLSNIATKDIAGILTKHTLY